MLKTQIEIIQLWHTAGDVMRDRASLMQEDRGEVTGQTAMIVLLVTAAIASRSALTGGKGSQTIATYNIENLDPLVYCVFPARKALGLCLEPVPAFTAFSSAKNLSSFAVISSYPISPTATTPSFWQ